MKNLNDILNRYIDGELSSFEILEFEKELENSPDLREKLNIMRRVDKYLRDVKPEIPSAMFTANVMKRLKSKSSFSKSQNYFMFSITCIFILLSLGITAYIVSLVLNSAAADTSNPIEISRHLNIIIDDLVAFIGNLFNPKYFSYIGSLISMIMLISGYFFFDNHRKMVKRTNN